ncbi:MAG: amidohydrolase [Bacteroidales bacterium]|nr:amidohydrolase [Bacteroidales bacterium]MDD4216720.1 amidohydrolase [Bacteroidales bacterium]MDY0141138.1 amidohydrolase [Bacteroidales bacterium]
MPDSELLIKLQNFRKDLHKYPELSGHEKETQKRIIDFLKVLNPDKIIKNIGGYGLAYIFDSGNSGPDVLFRADMDALPINETNNIEHKSQKPGVAHLCGHDGHIAVISGLTHLIDKKRPNKGRAIILFQPEEENGQGAAKIIKDKKFTQINPDYAFAFHNLPGYEKNTVFIKNGAFSSASTGVIIKLKGLSSHAAYPENGNSPDICLAELILEFNNIKNQDIFKDFVLLTVIHAKLGEIAFGTSPGEADIMLTIRSYLNDDMDKLKKAVNSVLETVCKKHKIKYNIDYTEYFPASTNDDYCVSLVRDAAEKSNIPILALEHAFRWSEDFGHFTINNKSAIFGIGSGKEHPQLHNENFDFPDEITETAITVFFEIYKKTLI